ncbi:hypothetical protein GCM10011492_26300 [Flexivirga endophytica]|uniref:Uncharacterized protein n=1 Tax=Flexivirga endophytica TaxID=1849103 RepID=A0A916T8Z2_9MICO|nr:hypothetical protein GCM10011492_26300 [Flexivirga endophytica]GHB42344.1 hypothetical protein GCM10008112_08680 [Flexivirga endophytica]
MADVARDVVGVGQRLPHGLLEVEMACPGSGHPQAESYGGWQIGHGAIKGMTQAFRQPLTGRSYAAPTS